MLGDFLVSIDPDLTKRTLATSISTLVFSDSPSTVYAVRVSAAGANDTATVLAIDFGSGTTLELAAVTYVRPEIVAETPLKDAQFIDEGGGIRLYWMEAGTLRLWVLGAGAWQIDPVSGATAEVAGEPLPTLWSPDGSKRIVMAESDTTSTLVLYRSGGTEVARTTVDGLVSHLRWAADGSQVTFTLARGSVRQDLFLWSLTSDTPPIQQTDTGAAFGGEWLGAKPLWRP